MIIFNLHGAIHWAIINGAIEFVTFGNFYILEKVAPEITVYIWVQNVRLKNSRVHAIHEVGQVLRNSHIVSPVSWTCSDCVKSEVNLRYSALNANLKEQEEQKWKWEGKAKFHQIFI